MKAQRMDASLKDTGQILHDNFNYDPNKLIEQGGTANTTTNLKFSGQIHQKARTRSRQIHAKNNNALTAGGHQKRKQSKPGQSSRPSTGKVLNSDFEDFRPTSGVSIQGYIQRSRLGRMRKVQASQGRSLVALGQTKMFDKTGASSNQQLPRPESSAGGKESSTAIGFSSISQYASNHKMTHFSRLHAAQQRNLPLQNGMARQQQSQASISSMSRLANGPHVFGYFKNDQQSQFKFGNKAQARRNDYVQQFEDGEPPYLNMGGSQVKQQRRPQSSHPCSLKQFEKVRQQLVQSECRNDGTIDQKGNFVGESYKSFSIRSKRVGPTYEQSITSLSKVVNPARIQSAFVNEVKNLVEMETRSMVREVKKLKLESVKSPNALAVTRVGLKPQSQRPQSSGITNFGGENNNGRASMTTNHCYDDTVNMAPKGIEQDPNWTQMYAEGRRLGKSNRYSRTTNNENLVVDDSQEKIVEVSEKQGESRNEQASRGTPDIDTLLGIPAGGKGKFSLVATLTEGVLNSQPRTGRGTIATQYQKSREVVVEGTQLAEEHTNQSPEGSELKASDEIASESPHSIQDEGYEVNFVNLEPPKKVCAQKVVLQDDLEILNRACEYQKEKLKKLRKSPSGRQQSRPATSVGVSKRKSGASVVSGSRRGQNIFSSRPDSQMEYHIQRNVLEAGLTGFNNNFDKIRLQSKTTMSRQKSLKSYEHSQTRFMNVSYQDKPLYSNQMKKLGSQKSLQEDTKSTRLKSASTAQIRVRGKKKVIQSPKSDNKSRLVREEQEMLEEQERQHQLRLQREREANRPPTLEQQLAALPEPSKHTVDYKHVVQKLESRLDLDKQQVAPLLKFEMQGDKMSINKYEIDLKTSKYSPLENIWSTSMVRRCIKARQDKINQYRHQKDTVCLYSLLVTKDGNTSIRKTEELLEIIESCIQGTISEEAMTFAAMVPIQDVSTDAEAEEANLFELRFGKKQYISPDGQGDNQKEEAQMRKMVIMHEISKELRSKMKRNMDERNSRVSAGSYSSDGAHKLDNLNGRNQSEFNRKVESISIGGAEVNCGSQELMDQTAALGSTQNLGATGLSQTRRDIFSKSQSVSKENGNRSQRVFDFEKSEHALQLLRTGSIQKVFQSQNHDDQDMSDLLRQEVFELCSQHLQPIIGELLKEKTLQPQFSQLSTFRVVVLEQVVEEQRLLKILHIPAIENESQFDHAQKSKDLNYLITEESKNAKNKPSQSPIAIEIKGFDVGSHSNLTQKDGDYQVNSQQGLIQLGNDFEDTIHQSSVPNLSKLQRRSTNQELGSDMQAVDLQQRFSRNDMTNMNSDNIVLDYQYNHQKMINVQIKNGSPREHLLISQGQSIKTPNPEGSMVPEVTKYENDYYERRKSKEPEPSRKPVFTISNVVPKDSKNTFNSLKSLARGTSQDNRQQNASEYKNEQKRRYGHIGKSVDERRQSQRSSGQNSSPSKEYNNQASRPIELNDLGEGLRVDVEHLRRQSNSVLSKDRYNQFEEVKRLNQQTIENNRQENLYLNKKKREEYQITPKQFMRRRSDNRDSQKSPGSYTLLDEQSPNKISIDKSAYIRQYELQQQVTFSEMIRKQKEDPQIEVIEPTEEHITQTVDVDNVSRDPVYQVYNVNSHDRIQSVDKDPTQEQLEQMIIQQNLNLQFADGDSVPNDIFTHHEDIRSNSTSVFGVKPAHAPLKNHYIPGVLPGDGSAQSNYKKTELNNKDTSLSERQMEPTQSENDYLQSPIAGLPDAGVVPLGRPKEISKVRVQQTPIRRESPPKVQESSSIAFIQNKDMHAQVTTLFNSSLALNEYSAQKQDTKKSGVRIKEAENAATLPKSKKLGNHKMGPDLIYGGRPSIGNYFDSQNLKQAQYQQRLDLHDMQTYIQRFNLKFMKMMQIVGNYNDLLQNQRGKINRQQQFLKNMSLAKDFEISLDSHCHNMYCQAIKNSEIFKHSQFQSNAKKMISNGATYRFIVNKQLMNDVYLYFMKNGKTMGTFGPSTLDNEFISFVEQAVKYTHPQKKSKVNLKQPKIKLPVIKEHPLITPAEFGIADPINNIIVSQDHVDDALMNADIGEEDKGTLDIDKKNLENYLIFNPSEDYTLGFNTKAASIDLNPGDHGYNDDPHHIKSRFSRSKSPAEYKIDPQFLHLSEPRQVIYDHRAQVPQQHQYGGVQEDFIDMGGVDQSFDPMKQGPKQSHFIQLEIMNQRDSSKDFQTEKKFSSQAHQERTADIENTGTREVDEEIIVPAQPHPFQPIAEITHIHLDSMTSYISPLRPSKQVDLKIPGSQPGVSDSISASGNYQQSVISQKATMNPTFQQNQAEAGVGIGNGSSNVLSQSMQIHEPAYAEGEPYTIDHTSQNEETMKFTNETIIPKVDPQSLPFQDHQYYEMINTLQKCVRHQKSPLMNYAEKSRPRKTNDPKKWIELCPCCTLFVISFLNQ